MFSKTALFVVSSLSLLAAAMPAAPPTVSQCNTGNAACCNSVQSASNPAVASLLGLLGIVVQGVDVGVGLTCTPISVLALSQGANCAQQPVCCQGNTFNSLVNVGCTPLSL